MRECDCPRWVVRCAHIDGKLLTLDDVSLTRIVKALLPNVEGFERYGVIVDRDIPFEQRRRLACFSHERFKEEAAALEAFYAAEAALLGRSN